MNILLVNKDYANGKPVDIFFPGPKKCVFFTALISYIMKSHLFVTLILISAAAFVSCRSSKTSKPGDVKDKPQMVASPQAIIYKTRGDYFLHVPVTLSEDRKSLLAYPAPQDVFSGGDLAYPVRLENGYLLDRRGISPSSAFIKLTYYEYSRLGKTPTAEEIMKMILDDDPFTIIYQCGPKHSFRDIESDLNAIILDGKEDNFKKLK
ncbi:hypothetical protein SDC9_18000 [bioreactor metagenome]|uniref:Uncharacterized protein n=1 Tax=bioreactor metagenome TaxID=1076179 RepID=A0A644TZY1_9ZZZZ